MTRSRPGPNAPAARHVPRALRWCPRSRPGVVRSALLFALLLSASFSIAAAQEEDRRQQRPSKVRVDVPPDRVRVDDGDTVTIQWEDGDVETVRILGIDTPETQHVEHNIPLDQSFGRQAASFAWGAFAAASRVEILRADMMDRYGRTLAYLFVNGKNYSELIVRARLAAESVSHFGDNGFPEEAQVVLQAARAAGPIRFEPPYLFRRRMRDVSNWMREHGELPAEDN
ncbi:MAG: thermonuclease family protein [Candidatus Krumholzibacteriia bacterium]